MLEAAFDYYTYLGLTVDCIDKYEPHSLERTAGYGADMVAASGHTAVMVLAEAMRQAGTSDRKAIRDAIAGITLEASTGTISFNDLGEVRKDVQIQVVKDGAWRRHSVISDPELLAPPSE